MKLEYDSNNSGGSWWLDDDDWRKMEEAGWTVHWGGRMCKVRHKTYADIVASGDRYLGGLAASAEIETDDPKKTIREWESMTGQSVGDGGCQCCGPPHSFDWQDGDNYHSATAEYSSHEDWS